MVTPRPGTGSVNPATAIVSPLHAIDERTARRGSTASIAPVRMSRTDAAAAAPPPMVSGWNMV